MKSLKITVGKGAAFFGQVLVAMALLMAAPLASAQLTGQTVRAQHYFPNLSTPYGSPVDSVVGPGVEVTNFPNLDPRTNIDYSANSIRITYNSTSTWSFAAFNGIVFTDLNGTIPSITGVTLNAATNMVGLDASRISFDANTVRINWQGLPFTPSTVVVLDLSFAAAPAAAIPTLSEWMLIALMLMVAAAGMVLARRRY